MENTSKAKTAISKRDRSYYRRRQQNRVFDEIVRLFAEESERGTITKKKLADLLDKDPAQVTRWLSHPANLELDTISDILLAMGAEMDHSACRFEDRSASNYMHPLLAACLTQQPKRHASMVLINAPKPESGAKMAVSHGQQTRTSGPMNYRVSIAKKG